MSEPLNQETKREESTRTKLFTDLYEITMLSVYSTRKMIEPATFQPIRARTAAEPPLPYRLRLDDLFEALARFRFHDDDIGYRRSLRMFPENLVEIL